MNVDANANPVDRMGSMDAGAYLASRVREDLRAKSKAPSVYGSASSDQNFDVVDHEICFTVPQAGSANNTRLEVLSNISGMGTESTSKYGTNPEHKDIHREAVRARIRYAGVAVGSVNYARGKNNIVTVAFAGLNTIRQGSRKKRDVVPGDLIVAEVPDFDEKEKNLPPGIPPGKIRLQAQAYEPKSTAESLQTHIRHVLDNPRKWRDIMGERFSNTNAWMTAVKRTVDSYVFGGVMGVMEAMNAGLIQPTAKMLSLLSVDDRATVQAGIDVIADLDSDDKSAARIAEIRVLRASSVIVVHLCDYLKLIPYSSASKSLSAVDSARMSLFRIRLQQRIFHSVSSSGNGDKTFNVANEFGFYRSEDSINPPTYRARYPNKKRVRQNDPYGDTLNMQLNHFKRAATAISHAQKVDFSFIIGKSTTGSRAGQNMNISLGVCRP